MSASDAPRKHTEGCRFWRQSKCDCGATAFNAARDAASDEPRYLPPKTRDEIDAKNAEAAKRYVQRQQASDEPRHYPPNAWHNPASEDVSGEPRESNGAKWHSSRCPICGEFYCDNRTHPVLAAVLAEVARQEEGIKNGGTVVAASRSEWDFLIFRAGFDFRQLLRLKSGGAT